MFPFGYVAIYERSTLEDTAKLNFGMLPWEALLEVSREALGVLASLNTSVHKCRSLGIRPTMRYRVNFYFNIPKVNFLRRSGSDWRRFAGEFSSIICVPTDFLCFVNSV